MAWVVGALVIFNLIWTFDFYIIFGSLFSDHLKFDFWKLRDNFIEYIHTKIYRNINKQLPNPKKHIFFDIFCIFIF